MLSQAVKEDLAPHRFLDKLLEVELSRREERRTKTSLKLSGLPTGQTLGNFDFTFQPGIEKSRIETLATCAFLREHATVLVCGPPGTGKTYLAVALGVKAVENCFSMAFYRLEDLLHAMKQDADVAPRRLRGKKHLKVSLLIIDEVGFQPRTRQEASLFFRLVSYRISEGEHHHHHEQGGSGLARSARRRRGDGHRDSGPAPASLSRPRHQGAFVQAQGEALEMTNAHAFNQGRVVKVRVP